MATTESQLSLILVAEPFVSTPNQGNCGRVFCSSTTQNPRRTCIANANGATYPITGAGTVPLSPSLSLAHTLLVPSLSNKLMSVSQVTKELNCVVLIYSTFCLLRDILSKELIGRGTKRGGTVLLR